MKNKIFILSYTGYHNLGDDMMIDLIDGKEFSNFEIVILSRRTYYKKKTNYIYRYNLIKYFLSITNNDILLNLGGTFQDRTSLLSFFYYFFMNLIFLLKKGKIIFLNTEFSDVRYCKKFLYYLLKYSRLTVLRSKKEYSNCYKKFKNVYYSPDIVFLYQFNKSIKQKKKVSYSLVSLRKHVGIKQFLEKLKHTGDKFKFLVMYGERGIKKLIEKYFPEEDIYIYNYFNKNEIFNLIYYASKIITMRYHIGVIGLLFNKHIEILSFNNKIKILNDDFGICYFNGKKNIDILNKKQYINKSEIIKVWSRLKDKINEM